jgi:tripartite-type tricarboxylate transporter receptor subunit TctC
MTLARRAFFSLAAGAAALPLAASAARTQAYPTRPVVLVMHLPAGSAPDTIARLIGQSLSQHLGTPVVIENRLGGGGNVALEAVARAEPDGYTLLGVAALHCVNVTLNENAKFNVVRDIAPVASLIDVPFVMLASPSAPFRTVPEFISYAKAHPGTINMGSLGTGNLTHLAGELFKMMAKIEMVHVPYRGAVQAQDGLLSGDVQVMFDAQISALPQIQAGRLRALAVTTNKRQSALPDIPAIAEFVPGYSVSGWLGIGAPKGTSSAIVDRLNKDINAVIADPRIRKRLADLGSQVLSGTPADFGRLIGNETEKWAKVVRFAGLKQG